ncbi:MAG TPA: hypothetical protein VGN91_20045, partial [Bosea sp. (in: a-proteobacteria)]|nr:hypothetical protein [Bosea sp. (in: a-proteobacteria)]
MSAFAHAISSAHEQEGAIVNCQPSACSAAVRGEGGCRNCMVRLVSVCASLTDDELALLEQLAVPT